MILKKHTKIQHFFLKNNISSIDNEFNVSLEQNETNYASMFLLYENRQKVDIVCGNKILHGCFLTSIDYVIDCDNTGVVDVTFNVDYVNDNNSEEYMNDIKRKIRQKKLDSL